MIKTDLKKKREFDQYSEDYASNIIGSFVRVRLHMDAFKVKANLKNTKDIHNYALSLTQDIEEFLDFIKEAQHTISE